MKTIKCKVTGRDIFYMNLCGCEAIRPYVSQRQWNSAGSKFLIGDSKNQIAYSYDIYTEELIKIGGASVDASLDAYVCDEDAVYVRCGNDIIKTDFFGDTYEKVAQIPPEVRTKGLIHLTNDGELLSAYWGTDEDYRDGEHLCVLPLLNTRTGRWDISHRHEFTSPAPYVSVGHNTINPVYKNLYFFCHEGDTQVIGDRLWIMNLDTDEKKKLFVQADNEELRRRGYTGETSGHEVWSSDGEEMYFVKYPYYGQNLGQSGIVRISKDGREREYVNGDYHYWHVGASADKKWLCAETQIGNRTEIVLINALTYKSYVVAAFDSQILYHPRQPHPVFSSDGKKISFQMDDENGILGVGWVDIGYIVDKPIEGGRFNISEGIDYVSYAGTDSFAEKKDGAFVLDANRYLYIDITDEKLYGNCGTFAVDIEMFDNGSQRLELIYTGEAKKSSELCERENRHIYFDGAASGCWITKRVYVNRARINNAGKYRTDFKLGAVKPTLIRNVRLVRED